MPARLVVKPIQLNHTDLWQHLWIKTCDWNIYRHHSVQWSKSLGEGATCMRAPWQCDKKNRWKEWRMDFPSFSPLTWPEIRVKINHVVPQLLDVYEGHKGLSLCVNMASRAGRRVWGHKGGEAIRPHCTSCKKHQLASNLNPAKSHYSAIQAGAVFYRR